MKRALIGAFIVVLSGLGNLFAQDQANFQMIEANSFQTKFVAGNGNYFFQDAEIQRCVVSDPTGTRLNIRDIPNGKIVGKLKNGTVVYTDNDMYDTKNRNWIEIKLTRRGKAKGWVIGEFLDCE
jgi:hypothetical protein